MDDRGLGVPALRASVPLAFAVRSWHEAGSSPLALPVTDSQPGPMQQRCGAAGSKPNWIEILLSRPYFALSRKSSRPA